MELPTRTVLCQVPLFIRKRHSQLNQLQQIHIASQRLILIIRFVIRASRRLAAQWPCHHSRELRVHRDVWVLHYCFANHRHFLCQIVFPHITDLDLASIERIHMLFRLYIGSCECPASNDA
jgi:hypothetical protein